MSTRRRPDQRGSATVLGIAMIGLLVTAALVGATCTGLLVGQRRAAAGADLAALAGASALQAGRDGCAGASELANTNHVRLARCESSRDVVTVQVVTDVASVFGWTWSVGSQARAGPVR